MDEIRLIDANELKKHADAFSDDNGMISGYVSIEAIDNAPTIFPKEFEPLLEAIIDALPTIVEKIERPTGEWLKWEDERWGGVWHYCSNCHNDALYKNVDGIFKQILSDFCPYCGVKMKGDEEE